jgi:intracellular sulfur oxidation DsrE/DsrF family protein
MHRFSKLTGAVVLAAALLVAGAATAHANPSMLKTFKFDQPAFIKDHPFAKAHVVIQVSQDDPARWHLVLNNVQNMLNYLGEDQIQIVVVSYGPGLKMLLPKSRMGRRIAALSNEGVEFDACHNTMEHMARKLGHMPTLVPDAVIVPAGVIRIVQLESHGFTYIKP